MSMVCAFGPMAAPRAAECPAEPDATHFRVGDVWRSPVGTRYRVVSGGRKTVALQGGAGKTARREWDAIGAHTNNPWIRESWGGQP